jgi:hypothetical protein
MKIEKVRNERDRTWRVDAGEE